MKLLSAFLAFSFVFNQTVAIAQTTEASAKVATAQILANQLQNSDPATALSAANSIEASIDQNMGEFQKAEAADTDSASPADAKKISKWEDRLTRRLPHAQKALDEKIDGMDEATLKNEMQKMADRAKASGNLDLAAKIQSDITADVPAMKANLKSGFAANSQSMIPEMAKNIVTAGGLVHYMMQLKKQIHEKKTAVAQQIKNKGGLDRKVADSDIDWPSTLELCAGIAAAIFLIFFFGGWILGVILVGSAAVLILGMSYVMRDA